MHILCIYCTILKSQKAFFYYCSWIWYTLRKQKHFLPIWEGERRENKRVFLIFFLSPVSFKGKISSPHCTFFMTEVVLVFPHGVKENRVKRKKSGKRYGVKIASGGGGQENPSCQSVSQSPANSRQFVTLAPLFWPPFFLPALWFLKGEKWWERSPLSLLISLEILLMALSPPFL